MMQADLLIIGSGQGGVPLAVEMAEKGRQVVIFERASWGGSCINYGCTPSKSFLASAHTAQTIRDAGRLGIHGQLRINFQAVMDRVREIISSWSSGVEDRLSHPNITKVNQEAVLIDSQTAAAGEEKYRAEQIIINTGKSPFVPPIRCIEDVPFLTYEKFWGMESQPDRMIIVGGGYTGVELGQGMARLGTEVEILERNQRIIHREEKQVSELIQQALAEDGVRFHFQADIKAVHHQKGSFLVDLASGQNLEGDGLLMSTGRKPNTEALFGNGFQLETDQRGHIVVDKHFQTSAEGIFAIGDVTGQPAFTHVSWEDHRRLVSILENGGRQQGDRPLAYAFFTSPQVGRAGLSLTQAQERGFSAREETLPLNEVARALEVGRTRGFYSMVIEESSGRILGATLIGPQAAELVHILLAHIQTEATWQDLASAMYIHPAYAEALPTLARKFHST